ncbi:unnamed protein product [Arctogadus glacialis]
MERKGRKGRKGNEAVANGDSQKSHIWSSVPRAWDEGEVRPMEAGFESITILSPFFMGEIECPSMCQNPSFML